MKLNDIYRSDQRFDKMGAAQHITDWYDEIYDTRGEQKQKIDYLLQAHEISGEDPDEMYRMLLTIDPQDLSKLYRNIKNVMGENDAS